MRDLSDILADCRVAFGNLTESEKANAAESLVGKNAMSGFLCPCERCACGYRQLSGAIDNCDGSAEKMAATMQDNLAGQLTILKSQLQELAISFGEILMPAIRNIVSKIQGFIDKLNGHGRGDKAGHCENRAARGGDWAFAHRDWKRHIQDRYGAPGHFPLWEKGFFNCRITSRTASGLPGNWERHWEAYPRRCLPW